MYGAFEKIRANSPNPEVIYPTTYYEVVSKTIEELAPQKNKRLAFLEDNTVGSAWLIGEFGASKISEKTYNWIWSNLKLAIEYERDDYIKYHWENANQHIDISLHIIHPEYSNENYQIINQEEIDDRFLERQRFLEFHYALGGLLLYKQNYKCIKRAFNYTQSLPPRYELLPDTMNEIFKWYFDFKDPYRIKHSWISSQYNFPEISGIKADEIIKKWICEYVAVLYIRQYSIVPPLVIMKPLNPPSLPTTQREKRQWIDNLDYFKKLVEGVLKNKLLLNTLELDFVTDKWCEENECPKPLELIEKVKQDVINSIERTSKEQHISEDKKQKFKDKSVSILLPILNDYEIINNKNKLNGKLNKWYVNGQSNIIDKSAFADDQDADIVNFDSFLATNFSNKYRSAIFEIFDHASTQSYLLNSEDIVAAISRLKINVDDYMIVSFGIDIDTLISTTKNENIKGIETIKFDLKNPYLPGNSLFVTKKADLPRLNYKQYKANEIEKYSLEKVIDKFNLYLTVVDLNKSEDLRNTFSESVGEKDLHKSVFMGIFMDLEVHWKKGAQCIQIKQASPYFEKGIINKISEVKPVKD